MTLVACRPAAETTEPSPPAPAVQAEPAPPQVCEAVAVPDTAPGHRLEHLIAALVDADATLRERFVDEEMAESFLDAIPRERHLAVLGSISNGGRPILLCRVESTTDEHIVAVVGGVDEKGEVEYGRFLLGVEGPQAKVATLAIEPAKQEDLTREIVPLDAAGTAAAVEAVAGGLEEYVFADKAAKMQSRIREALAAGEYAGVTDHRALAERLAEDLRGVSGDKHLGVLYSASVLDPPQPEQEPTPEEIADFRKQAAGDNFGMPVAEIREGNIGYLLLLGFLPPEIAGEAFAETMSKLADADALIIDLRQNGGGSPHGVALLSSYLFGEKPVHLNDIYTRSEDRTESFHTDPAAPGAHFGAKKPIFVLTSSRTFSAGEEFAYNLKALRRAKLIGETTGGGAHPTKFVRVADHWAVFVPHARAINPITKTNWEGTGVKPHIQVPADQALDKAMELAAKAKKSKKSK